MREGEPVGSVGEEGIAEAGVVEGIVDFCDPRDDCVGKNRMGMRKDASQPVSCSRGKAVRPLKIRPRLKRKSQRRMDRRS